MSGRPIIKNMRHGVASNDGNGMVGGRWWGCERLAHKGYIIDDLLDKAIPDLDVTTFDATVAYFKEKGFGTVEMEAYFEVGSDESVGLSDYCDLDESFLPDDFEDAVNDCPFITFSDGDALLVKAQEIADEEGGYEFYDLDLGD